MKEFWWLLDFKWTDTLISDVLERIPSDWVEFIANLSANEVRDLLTDHLVEDKALPEELFKFVVRCRELSLRSSWSSVYSSNSSSRSRTNKKISEKKRVEIEHVQKLVLDVVTDQLRLSSSDVTVLDLGAGLGYISEALHNSGFNVIGIECNEKLCITANDRYADKNIRFVPLKIDESNECLGSVTELVRDRNNVIVLGLHCCGDLLNNALEMFSKVDQIKAAICVTCCYHLITIPKFPRSETLKTLSRELDVAFNSTVLRVGTYDPPLRWCRDLNQEKLDTHTKTSFYRAVFERFLKQPNVTWSRPVKKKIGSVLNGTFSEFIESVELGFRSDSDVDISV
ncbi:hypothetical protein HDE_08856 [Halotydeus destructor]|nr:hypothetical protein HDE_08856 [Halotydeus destructor]